jgi:hypothetical protein
MREGQLERVDDAAGLAGAVDDEESEEPEDFSEEREDFSDEPEDFSDEPDDFCEDSEEDDASEDSEEPEPLVAAPEVTDPERESLR